MTVRRTCELLKAVDARTLILIDGLADERVGTAGRADLAPRLHEREWALLVAAIRRASEIAAGEFELRAVIHPHVGTHVEFEDEVERVLAEVGPEYLGLCVDTGHSVYGGIDPVALIQRHAERVAHVHFKDVDERRLAVVRDDALSFLDAVAQGIFVPLGEGCVDFAGVFAALERLGYDGWATVEQDRLPDRSATPLDEARQSLAYLRSLGPSGPQ